jgi:hypothetical protein
VSNNGSRRKMNENDNGARGGRKVETWSTNSFLVYKKIERPKKIIQVHWFFLGGDRYKEKLEIWNTIGIHQT